MKNAVLLLMLVGLFAFTGCESDDANSPTSPADTSFESQFPVNEDMPGVQTDFSLAKEASGDIVDTAVANEFNTLVAAVQAAGLEDALRSEGPFTVFAPTDDAFAKLPEGLVEQLLLPENQDKLQQILLYHVVEGKITSRDLRFYQEVETLEGSELEILRFFRLVLVNRIPVELADVMASNGVIHVIDEVLIPEGFSLEDPAEPTLDLVDTAVAAELSTLVAAVQAAGLEDALRGDGPLTVFAPSNAAFADLPAGLLDELLLPENQALLQDLLLYHVTEGQVLSTDLGYFQRVEMLNGQKTYVFAFRWGVFVNFSKVAVPDVLATNGVAHVINRVLIPPHFYGQLSSLPAEAPELSRDMYEVKMR